MRTQRHTPDDPVVTDIKARIQKSPNPRLRWRYRDRTTSHHEDDVTWACSRPRLRPRLRPEADVHAADGYRWAVGREGAAADDEEGRGGDDEGQVGRECRGWC